jgi:hypothetical protein
MTSLSILARILTSKPFELASNRFEITIQKEKAGYAPRVSVIDLFDNTSYVGYVQAFNNNGLFLLLKIQIIDDIEISVDKQFFVEYNIVQSHLRRYLLSNK